MRKLAVCVALATLSGCYAVPTWKTKLDEQLVQVRRPLQYPDVDKVAQMVITCDQLGFRQGTDAHRLCIMRGADRYIDHQTPPLSERYVSTKDQLTVTVPQTVPVDPCCAYPQYPAYPGVPQCGGSYQSC